MAQDIQDGQKVVEEKYAPLGNGEGPGPAESVSTKRLIALIAGPALAVLLLFVPAPEGMKLEAWRLVALAVWMVVWWLGEAVLIPTTAFLAMWISNTATTIMMFAVGLSVIKFISQKAPHRLMVRNFGVALMLGIAYSASIGGVGTLIGTPPNALLASFLQSTYNIQIDFFTWMKLGVPVVLVMLPIA